MDTDNPHELSMKASGGSSLVGVVKNRWVHGLADLFLFLFHEKCLNPRTFKGYRSAISSTISSCGSRSEFTNSTEITSLIRSFQIECPPKRTIAPQWNLSLVLQAMVKPPFEPINSIELKFLTLKTVFLVTLAPDLTRFNKIAI